MGRITLYNMIRWFLINGCASFIRNMGSRFLPCYDGSLAFPKDKKRDPFFVMHTYVWNDSVFWVQAVLSYVSNQLRRFLSTKRSWNFGPNSEWHHPQTSHQSSHLSNLKLIWIQKATLAHSKRIMLEQNERCCGVIKKWDCRNECGQETYILLSLKLGKQQLSFCHGCFLICSSFWVLRMCLWQIPANQRFLTEFLRSGGTTATGPTNHHKHWIITTTALIWNLSLD